MPPVVEVSFLPQLLPSQGVAGKAAVVIDILRASTTIVTALAQGAKAVWPCLEVEEARELQRGMAGALTGGERGGVPIEGFDCSNSPADYSRSVVAGRDVVFTTTNGTRALHGVRDAGLCCVGAFVNQAAVCRLVAGWSEVLLLCAGTNGGVTREDVLFAGALAEQLVADWGGQTGNDEAQMAREVWRQAQVQCGTGSEAVARMLIETQGGRNLAELGYEADLVRAAAVDRFDVVPQWDRERGCLLVP